MRTNLHAYPSYESHFGVYALILHPENGDILLIRKALGCYTGLYDLPGGTMEAHELLEETLRREVLEETGCTVITARQLETLCVRYPHNKNGRDTVLRHTGCVYLAEVSGTPRESSDGTDDSNGCVWVPQAEITRENAAPFVLMALAAYTRRSST